MSALVLCHERQGSREEVARLIQAALQLSSTVSVLMLGRQADAQALSTLEGIDQIYATDWAPSWLADAAARGLGDWIAQGDYRQVLMAADCVGKDLLPRIAASLDNAMISEVVQILAADTFVRPSYAGTVMETVQALEPRVMLTVRPMGFAPVGDANEVAVTPVAIELEVGLSQLLQRRELQSERPALDQAEVVIGAGRGVETAEQFALIEQLADLLGAAIGGSRALVDLGLIENEYQIGQTGKIIAPRLYIAVGISGASQHLAGIKQAGTIVAIDVDAAAPLMQEADYSLQGDLNTILPQLIAELQK
ncbi:electron transfer flavoprotein subunit alpha/FixB family protein [Ferrimonas pelagia]|uniref:FAD-binding protein n=1 Tax=Ferrimonas pelagia TaxID=1177826 RepID=A0ABP9ECH0_9GAMM